MNNGKKIGFLSYSHKDTVYCDLFHEGIKLHSHGKGLEYWTDAKIPLGSDWHQTIQEQIKKSNFAILLLSAAFFASKYIKQHEYKKFYELMFHTENFSCYPLIVNPCDTSHWPSLNKIQRFVARGRNYGLPKLNEITYSDLVRFDYEGIFIPNPNIERFHMNFVYAILESMENM